MRSESFNGERNYGGLAAWECRIRIVDALYDMLGKQPVVNGCCRQTPSERHEQRSCRRVGDSA